MKELLLIGAALFGFVVISGGMNKRRAAGPSLQPLGAGGLGGAAASPWEGLLQMLTDRTATGLPANSADEEIGVDPVGSKAAPGYKDKTAAITPVVIVNEEKEAFLDGSFLDIGSTLTAAITTGVIVNEEQQAFLGGSFLDIGSESTAPIQEPVGIISAGPTSGFSFDWPADITIDQSIGWSQVVAPSGEIRDSGFVGGFHTSPEILRRAILAMGPPNSANNPEPTTAPVLIAPYAPW